MPGDGGGAGPLARVEYEFICDDAPDTWYMHRMRLFEQINQPYELMLDLASETSAADHAALFGVAAELVMSRDEHSRSVFGIIADVEYIGGYGDQLLVRVRIVPATTLLRQSVHSRIFQEMSVVDIITEVLESKLADYDRTLDTSSLTRGQDPRDYCLQYREPDIDFATRLCEEEGISYCYKHDPETGHEVIVFTDENDQLSPVVNLDGNPLFPIVTARPDETDIESLQGFDWRSSMMPTASLRQDYDFVTPTEPLTAPVDGAEPEVKQPLRRLYFHMDRRYVKDDVKDRATDHVQAARMQGALARGFGNASGFSPGCVFELDRHSIADLEQEYVITQVVHTGYWSGALKAADQGGFEADSPGYENRFECIPKTTPVRPRQTTPKPRIYGPQTAIVCGPSGEEIHVDEHGRIMVQFHWEEEPKRDDTSSCWIRVMQSWAGPGWGFQFIPRIGMEVIVQFLEGNPDRPMVTGCVYNGDNAYPYAMPDNKTQSGIKTESSTGGGGNNEIRFEDAAGSEEVYFHAQKDMNTAVENDQSNTVGNNQTITVTADRTKTIEGNQTEEVTKDKTITIHGNHTETVDKDYTTTITGKETRSVTKDQAITVSGSRTDDVTGDQTQSITGSHSQTVTKGSQETVLAAKNVSVVGLYAEEVGGARTSVIVGEHSINVTKSSATTAGKDVSVTASSGKLSTSSGKDTSVSAGAKMTLTAKKDVLIKGDAKGVIEMKQLLIKCGGASISLKDGNIVLKGTKITLKGSGDVKIKGSKIGNN